MILSRLLVGCLTVVSTIMSGILLACFPIVEYVTDQGEKRRGGGKPKALIVVKDKREKDKENYLFI